MVLCCTNFLLYVYLWIYYNLFFCQSSQLFMLHFHTTSSYTGLTCRLGLKIRQFQMFISAAAVLFNKSFVLLCIHRLSPFSLHVLMCLNKLDGCSSEISECISVSHIFLSSFVCSTILEEEKLQQKERNRMEMRRQVTVSWDSGGSDEAPPKVRSLYAMRVCVTGCLLACSCKKAKIIIINNNCCVGASHRRTLASLQVLLRYLLTLHSHCVHL